MNCMDGWIIILKYWEELDIKIEWHSSVNKFTFELGGAIWVLPLDPVKVKGIWYLLTEHDSFGFLSLIKFNEVFIKKTIRFLYLFSLFENSCILRTREYTLPHFCSLKSFFQNHFWQKPKKRDYIKNVNSIILNNAKFYAAACFFDSFSILFPGVLENGL